MGSSGSKFRACAKCAMASSKVPYKLTLDSSACAAPINAHKAIGAMQSRGGAQDLLQLISPLIRVVIRPNMLEALYSYKYRANDLSH